VSLALREYAAAKNLPEGFLRRLGLADTRYRGAPAVRIPYRDQAGIEVAVRFRLGLDKGADEDGRFRWKKGARPCLYGLERIGDARTAGFVVLVEGESDAHTLWHYGIPALGIPGATNWQEPWGAALDGIATVYLVVEPDRGGEALRAKLARSRLRDRARLVTLNGAKDPSELHVSDPAAFAEKWEAAVEAAAPWSPPASSGPASARPTIKGLAVVEGALAEQPDIRPATAPRGGYARVFQTLWTGTLRARPDAQLVFVFLLAHCGAEGVADVTPRTIADGTGLPLGRVQDALAELEAEDPVSRSPKNGGARLVLLDAHRPWGWRIVNHAGYRERTAAERQAHYRHRHRDEVRARDRERRRRERGRA